MDREIQKPKRKHLKPIHFASNILFFDLKLFLIQHIFKYLLVKIVHKFLHTCKSPNRLQQIW